ncbi:hypothetical protein QR680_007557 [Steinernema hermaphroditum]|uniref:RING-type domain-containing protein n=1 Tax=Steinernema hermaphroditum TaxID=289476 RepID=A0AA39IF43_9BILA|nr:hypothetical protein QR680_007557 [Steinernema hermaphroditum]
MWSAPVIRPAHQIFGCAAEESKSTERRLDVIGMPQTNLGAPSCPQIERHSLEDVNDDVIPEAPKEVGAPIVRSPPHIRTKFRVGVKSFGSKRCVICEREMTREPCALLCCGHRAHLVCLEEARVNSRPCGICMQRREQIEEMEQGFVKRMKLICCL